MNEILYTIYEAFGGACSERQALLLDEVTPTVLANFIKTGYLRKEVIDGVPFLICRHSVYVMADNANQNYRLTTYNLKKSCLLAEYWLQTHHSVHTILSVLKQGTMHQRTMGPWGEYINYLHNQDCYARLLVPEQKRRYFVWFPKSNDPYIIAANIKSFFNEQGKFEDIDEITPCLGIRISSSRMIDAVRNRIDGRYWWIFDRLQFFELNCPDTQDII